MLRLSLVPQGKTVFHAFTLTHIFLLVKPNVRIPQKIRDIGRNSGSFPPRFLGRFHRSFVLLHKFFRICRKNDKHNGMRRCNVFFERGRLRYRFPLGVAVTSSGVIIRAIHESPLQAIGVKKTQAIDITSSAILQGVNTTPRKGIVIPSNRRGDSRIARKQSVSRKHKG